MRFSRTGFLGHAVFDLMALKHAYSLIMKGVDEILDVAAAQFESVDFLCEQHNTRLLFAKYRRQVRVQRLPVDGWNDLQGPYVDANRLAPLFGEVSGKL